MKTKRKYRLDVEKSFSMNTIFLIALGVIINVLGARLVIFFNLPLYLDNIGSVLAAALGGPIPGMVTAFTSNYLGYFGEPSAIMFGVLTVTMACLAAELSQTGLLRKVKGYVLLWIMMVAIGGAIGSVMGWYLYGKTMGGTIAAPYVFWLCDHGLNGFWAQFWGDVFLDMTDKCITILIVAVVLHFFPGKLRNVLPLSYIYNCSSDELEKEYDKRKVPYAGRSVFNKIICITTFALSILAIVVTWYSTRSYLTNKFSVDHDTYALFEYVVQLIGLEFVVIIFTIILSSWMTYEALTKPLDAIVKHSTAFSSSDQEKWLDSEQWKNRYVVKTKDEIQVLYDTICQSEETIAQKVTSIRESENKLRRLSETDLMTGIKNRGSGEHEIIRLIQDGVPGLFCLLDCDKFKSINDTYGHIAGDCVLISIAQKMQEICEETDVVLRLGGDEFAMYLRNIHEEKQAQEFFSAFFNSIDSICIPELKGHKIFVSLGAAFNHGDTDLRFDDLYKQADLELYKSKKAEGFAANISSMHVPTKETSTGSLQPH